ncbi:LysR family transcriptional regulator [Microbacterium sp. A93]|uniref:LysR family transcriptional regulator n=1 Tax=Microbacterium sp. A93 TaxID=3450716 RepID=UPI003F443B33
MEFRQLEYFLALARTLSFTRTAHELYVVQSAVSQQIAKLEAELGVRLFERTSKRVVLTEAGELLRTRAEALTQMAQSIESEVGSFGQEVKGTLRVGLSQGAHAALDLVQLFARYHEAFPAVRLVIGDRHTALKELAASVASFELDVAFVSHDAALGLPHGLRGVTLATEELVVVCHPGHPLADRASTTLEELAASGPVLDSAPETRLRTIVDGAWQRAGIQRTSAIEVFDTGQLARYAAHGLGAALVSTAGLRFVSPPAGQRDFTILQLEEGIGYSVSCIFRSALQNSPPSRHFLALIADSGLDPEVSQHLREAAGTAEL